MLHFEQLWKRKKTQRFLRGKGLLVKAGTCVIALRRGQKAVIPFLEDNLNLDPPDSTSSYKNQFGLLHKNGFEYITYNIQPTTFLLN